MPTDFRDGKTFPRPGRLAMGRFFWLARVFDKARAIADGTIADYIYPCPIDQGMLERWGTTPENFNVIISTHRDDAAILQWAQETVPASAIDVANAWLLSEWLANLERQDREEAP